MRFTPTRTTQAGLSSVQISDGQLIFAYDTGNIYIDTAYGRFQQGINTLSDSSQLPLALSDKLYFLKNSKKLLYRGQPITGSSEKRYIVKSDAAAAANQWYLCQSDCTITLPQIHQQGDTVKVSTVLQTDNVIIHPYTGDTIQSDSSFVLDLVDSSVQFIWHDGKWVASQIVVPRQRMPLFIVDQLPQIGDQRIYYNRQSNRLYYWDGAWKGVADYQERVATLQSRQYESAYGVKLGKCTDLGIVYGSDSVQLTWRDPNNVELQTALLAEWKQTVLMKKAGQYPTGPSDSQAQTVAVTSKQLGNKNSYANNPIHQSPSDSTYYKLFSQSIAGEWNDLTANCYPLATAMSWGMVQAFVRAGRGPEIWPVGTIFEVEHSQYTVNGHGIYFRVVGHDQVPAADESLSHTMCLEMVDSLLFAPYDASELIYALTEDSTAQVGKSYYVYDGSSYVKLVEGTDYDVGDTVPVASWYEKNIDGRDAGSNNAVQSNMLQWANSDGSSNQWFTPQTIWDQVSTYLQGRNGFMKYLDPFFASAVQSAKLITARSTAEGGGSIIHSAKFWPLSVTQLYGDNNNGIAENVYLKYYSDGGSKVKNEPTQGPLKYWLRSPVATTANYHRVVDASGNRDYIESYTIRTGYSLACIIA